MTGTLFLAGIIVGIVIVALVVLNHWYWRRYELKHPVHPYRDEHVEALMRSEQGFSQTWPHG